MTAPVSIRPWPRATAGPQYLCRRLWSPVDRWIDPGFNARTVFCNYRSRTEWRDALRAALLITLQPDLSPSGFRANVYRPTISYDAKQLIEDRLVDPQNYRDRGERRRSVVTATGR